jgi:hypothetical protein
MRNLTAVDEWSALLKNIYWGLYGWLVWPLSQYMNDNLEFLPAFARSKLRMWCLYELLSDLQRLEVALMCPVRACKFFKFSTLLDSLLLL